MRYSKTTNGFYNSQIHTTMPNDCVEITNAEYEALIDGQSSGQIISSDENGFPVLETRTFSETAIAVAVASARAYAYRQESDPIFLKWQREEATQAEWLAKVAEIKLRFPDGVMPFTS